MRRRVAPYLAVDRAAVSIQRRGNLLEKPPSRILLLSRVGRQRIVAMLANTDHSGDLDLVRSQRDGLINRSGDPEPEPVGHRPAHVVGSHLVDVH